MRKDVRSRRMLQCLGFILTISCVTLLIGCANDENDSNPVVVSPQRSKVSTALIVQYSGRMSLGDPTPISMAKESCREYVELMDGVEDEASVVIFTSVVTVLQQVTHDKSTLQSALKVITSPGGATAMWDGLTGGIMQLEYESRNERRAAILFTNGRDNSSTQKPNECIERANANGVRVFVFTYGMEVDSTAVIDVANQTNGRYIHNPTREQIEEIFKDISEQK